MSLCHCVFFIKVEEELDWSCKNLLSGGRIDGRWWEYRNHKDTKEDTRITKAFKGLMSQTPIDSVGGGMLNAEGIRQKAKRKRQKAEVDGRWSLVVGRKNAPLEALVHPTKHTYIVHGEGIRHKAEGKKA